MEKERREKKREEERRRGLSFACSAAHSGGATMLTCPHFWRNCRFGIMTPCFGNHTAFFPLSLSL